MRNPEIEKKHPTPGEDSPNVRIFEILSSGTFTRARLSAFEPWWLFRFKQNSSPTPIYRAGYILQFLNEFRKQHINGKDGL